jgi:hypothetical protein
MPGLLLVIYIAAVIFYGVIYPVWAIVHCLRAPLRSKKSKTIWVVSMVLTWTIGSLLYGIFASKRRLFQGFFFIFIFTVIILFAGARYTVNRVSAQLNKGIAKTIQRIDYMNTEQLTRRQLNKLKTSLSTLGEEFKNYRTISSADKVRKTTELLKGFDAMMADNRITYAEYKVWMDKFKSRNRLNKQRKRLKRYK